MSIKDKTEQVLREIYILLSDGDAYGEDEDKIIIDKNEMVELFNELNVCIYGMMDEYGISQRGRDKAERDTKKIREDIIRDANKGAEDIYAAAFLYTDEALRRVLEVMQATTQSVKELCGKVEKDFERERESVKRNKMELRSQLQVFRDTDKYLKLIDEQNKAEEKAKKKEKQEESSPYAKIKPEIRVNPEYFEKTGMPLDEKEFGSADALSEAVKEEKYDRISPADGLADTEVEELKDTVIPEVKVNLDAEYFKWKESGLRLEDDIEEEKKEEKRSIFTKMRK